MFDDKVILITGGTGSWGNELTKQLLEKYDPKEIRIYSRGEPKQVQMKIKYYGDKRIKFIIGDVRDSTRLSLATRGADYVFHLAALKHVPICEENPWESVLTNVYGTRNVIEAAIENKVKKVIYVSTDKAVDPFNLYGICKSCGEKLIVAANLESEDTSFVCIRGGNVIGTSGSVIPLFKEQILKSNEITLTSPEMSRYFFPVSEAISLVFKAAVSSVGGEIFVMKMPACKIIDLAEVMINELGNGDVKVTNIGIRPGEKIYEVLVSRYESPRCVESGDYFIILPQLKIPKIKEHYSDYEKIRLEEFNSKNARNMGHEEIKAVLQKEGFFDKVITEKDHYYGKDLSDSELKDVFKREGWQPNNSD